MGMKLDPRKGVTAAENAAVATLRSNHTRTAAGVITSENLANALTNQDVTE